MKIFLFIAIALFASAPARAQITFTSDDFLSQIQGQGMTFTSFHDTAYALTDQQYLQSLIDLTGASKTWALGGSNWINEGTYADQKTIFAYPGNAPLAANFSGATHVYKYGTYASQDTIYDFWTINSTGAWELGQSQDSAGFTSVILSYSPPLQQWKFPLTYQTSWQNKVSVPVSPLDFPQGTVVTQTINGTCDGYGTVSVPGHSEEALHISLTEIGAASLGSISLGSSTTSITYWITRSGFQATIEVQSDGHGYVGPARYSSPAGSSVSEFPVSGDPLILRLSQNPASHETTLSYTLADDGPAQVMLMDPLGRNVRMLVNGRCHAGTNTIPIDPASLANGSYFLRVTADGRTATTKLLIQK